MFSIAYVGLTCSALSSLVAPVCGPTHRSDHYRAGALDSSCSHASPGQSSQTKPDQTVPGQASLCQTSLGQASPIAHSQSKSDQARTEPTPGQPGPDKNTPAAQAQARPHQATGYAFEYGPGRYPWKHFRIGVKKFLRADVRTEGLGVVHECKYVHLPIHA